MVAGSMYIPRGEMLTRGAMMVSISEERLKRGLTLWFYAQLYPSMAQTQETLDEDGDVLESVLLNEDDIQMRAGELAHQFYEEEMPHCAYTTFVGECSPTRDEYRLGERTDPSLDKAYIAGIEE